MTGEPLEAREKRVRQALGRDWLEIDAALEPIEEGTAGQGRRAFFPSPVWGPYASDERYHDEKFAYETAIGRAGVVTTAAVVEPPTPEDTVIDLTQGSEFAQPSA